jgi:hypothetical protein
MSIFKKNGSLKYSINFVKTCDLELLYLVFGNEVNLTHSNMLLSNTLFRHFYDATIGNINDVVYIYLKQGINEGSNIISSVGEV